MLNESVAQGRMMSMPVLKLDERGSKRVTFTLACDRDDKSADGIRRSDFIDCIAWGKNAQFIADYVTTGDTILVRGRLQTMRQIINGIQVKSVEIDVRNVYMCHKKYDDESDYDEAEEIDF